MIEVAAVLDGEHRLDDDGRQRVEGDRPPLLALAGDDRGEQRRIEDEPLASFAPELEPVDPVRHPARPVAGRRCRLVEDDADRRRVGSRGARLDRDDAGLAHELARLLERARSA